jgi:hypothetical protein
LPSLSSPTIPSDSTMGGWMPSFRLGSSWLAAPFAVVLAILMQSGTSHAYTPEQQQACQPDAMRLCGEFVPNTDAITACMIRKKSQLSPQCRVFFRSGRGRARPPRHPHHAQLSSHVAPRYDDRRRAVHGQRRSVDGDSPAALYITIWSLHASTSCPLLTSDGPLMRRGTVNAGYLPMNSCACPSCRGGCA